MGELKIKEITHDEARKLVNWNPVELLRYISQQEKKDKLLKLYQEKERIKELVTEKEKIDILDWCYYNERLQEIPNEIKKLEGNPK